ncbi:alpha/beta hydrolase [Microbacterium caowuchunii]|uniref:esterase/lipase family protein n=1 Tax=Microbacterium caowuchunii TaxID=2614638 RepID=UPI001247766F|nr:alpha/beta hydrolase [Microbacterium caowuchunii]QEV99175.1 alpha/beta hydrolase [Microbacterium caowuchunii]
MTEPLRRLRWWAADYLYAGLWQVRAAFDRTDPGSFRNGDRQPIVVVPGVYETWQFLHPLIAALHERGHPVHIVDPLHDNRMPVDAGAALVSDYLVAQDLRDVLIVAHSKGGLIGKHVMALGPAGDRVRCMVAVAAPFGGSVYARYMIMRSLRSFSPQDRTILALAAETGVNARIVSIYSRFDPHIPEGSALAGAKNVQLETGGHFRILAHPRIVAEVESLADTVA